MFLVLAFATVPFSYDGALRPGQKLTVRDINGTVRVRTGDRLAIRATKHRVHERRPCDGLGDGARHRW